MRELDPGAQPRFRPSAPISSGRGLASFAVHDDPLSHDLLDLVLWMAVSTTFPDGLSPSDFESALLERAWALRPPAGLGFAAYAPSFISDWWDRRFSEGALVQVDGRGRLAPVASTAIAAKVDRGA